MKPIPGSRSRCRDCKELIVFAMVMRSESGRGGKHMALNPEQDPAGNVAVRGTSHGRAVCRVLRKDESYVVGHEVPAMPHAATCAKRLGRDLADEVENFLKQQTEETR